MGKRFFGARGAGGKGGRPKTSTEKTGIENWGGKKGGKNGEFFGDFWAGKLGEGWVLVFGPFFFFPGPFFLALGYNFFLQGRGAVFFSLKKKKKQKFECTRANFS